MRGVVGDTGVGDGRPHERVVEGYWGSGRVFT